jgi:hypothetical protein
MKHVLNIGGLIALGFTSDMKYMVAVSHSGTGLYQVDSWERVSRSSEMNYPENGYVSGIGILNGVKIAVVEKDYETECLMGISPNQAYKFEYDDGLLTIQKCA